MMTFGPIPSRRLGRSLGINNIPPKSCSYSCVYCQVGPTGHREIEPQTFYTPGDILAAVEERLEAAARAGEGVDYLTFVPDGEPTLDRAKGDLLHTGNDRGDAPAQVGEDKAAKSRGGFQCLVEGGLGDDHGAHGGLGKALGRIARAREDAAGSEHTGLARQHTIEHCLTATLADDLHPHAPFKDQHIVFAGGTDVKYRLVRINREQTGTLDHRTSLGVA